MASSRARRSVIATPSRSGMATTSSGLASGCVQSPRSSMTPSTSVFPCTPAHESPLGHRADHMRTPGRCSRRKRAVPPRVPPLPTHATNASRRPFAVGEDLRPRRSVVRARVRRILELVGHVGAGLAGERLRASDVALRIGGLDVGARVHDLGAQRAQHRPACRSTSFSGRTMTQRYSRTAHTIASPTPVLPALASTMVPPGLQRAAPLSASSTIASAARSFTLPPGREVLELHEHLGALPVVLRDDPSQPYERCAPDRAEHVVVDHGDHRPAYNSRARAREGAHIPPGCSTSDATSARCTRTS
jgi:hypothetical protein